MKITVEGQLRVELYPEDDEPVNILNVKRGIVSALIVPVMEEEMNKKMVASPDCFLLPYFCQYLQQLLINSGQCHHVELDSVCGVDSCKDKQVAQ